SADFWPPGSFSAALIPVFVCLRGNALASFTPLSAGCATGALVSCCGAGRCSLTAAAAGGGVGLGGKATATSLGGGLGWRTGECRRRSRRGRGQQPPDMRQQIGADRTSEAGGADLDELHEKAREVGNLARHGTPLRRNPGRIPTAAGGEFRAPAARKSDDTAE